MSDWLTLKERGNTEYKNKNYNAAIAHYTEAIELNSNEDALYNNRALCYTALKKFKKAIYDLEKAINLNPKNIKAIKRLYNIYFSLGNFGSAEPFAEKCINLEPKEYSHKADLETFKNIKEKVEDINKEVARENFVRVEEYSNSVLEKCPEFTEIKKIYIESLLQNNKPTEVIQFINGKVNDEEKKDEDFDYYLAKAFYFNGDYDTSKKIVQRAMRNGDGSQKYQKLLTCIRDINKEKDKANEVFKANKIDEAIEEYTKLLEFDPENKMFNSTILANRALCHQKKKNLLQALTDINKALAYNPKYVKGIIRRGNINMELKNYDDANHDYQAAKDLDPNDKDIDLKIKEAKSQQKKHKKDYYGLLGIDKTASQDDIKRAYKKMAMKYHPDRNNKGTEEEKKQAEKMFKDINEANTVLTDPNKKQIYDNGGDPDDPNAGFGGPGGFSFNFGGDGGSPFGGGIDPSEIFKVFFSQGAGGGGFSSSSFGGSGGGSSRSRGSRGGAGASGDPFTFFYQR